MSVLMKVVGFTVGVACPFEGEYLESFDHDAEGGLGYGTFTPEKDKAKKFCDIKEALEFWQRQSTVRLTRPDGSPNRPLTCTTVAFENV